MLPLTLYFDGGNEKQKATWAVVAKTGNIVVAKLAGLVPDHLPQTNNMAEWSALHMAVIFAYANRDSYMGFLIKGDSELVVKQVNKEYAVSKEHLKPLFKTCRQILDKMEKPYRILWIPREDNAEADALGRIIRIQA